MNSIEVFSIQRKLFRYLKEVMLVFSLQLLAFEEVLLKIAEFLFPRNNPKNSDIGIFGELGRGAMRGLSHTGRSSGHPGGPLVTYASFWLVSSLLMVNSFMARLSI